MIMNWIGLVMGVAAILLGAAFEGLHINALIQPTAAMIVGGGTLGATILAVTAEEFSGALKAIPKMFFKGGSHNIEPLIKQIVEIATVARREGLLGLEKYVPQIKNPFFAKNLRFLIDGYDATVLKEMMEDRIGHEEKVKVALGKVYETGGGFSPTIGIIGAVLGLIHVMGNLSDSSKLGSGIAVAFVATVYGVGGANLVLIPMGNKLKKIGADEIHEMELVMSGILGIQAGLNPRVIEDRLWNLVGEHGGGHGAKGDAKKAA